MSEVVDAAHLATSTGVKTQDGGKQAKVQKLAQKEILMVNIGSTATEGKVRRRKFGPAIAFVLTGPCEWGAGAGSHAGDCSPVASYVKVLTDSWAGGTFCALQVLALGEDTSRREEYAKILLTQPVCTQEGEKIALSRRVDKHWRLIGWYVGSRRGWTGSRWGLDDTEDLGRCPNVVLSGVSHVRLSWPGGKSDGAPQSTLRPSRGVGSPGTRGGGKGTSRGLAGWDSLPAPSVQESR